MNLFFCFCKRQSVPRLYKAGQHGFRLCSEMKKAGRFPSMTLNRIACVSLKTSNFWLYVFVEEFGFFCCAKLSKRVLDIMDRKKINLFLDADPTD